MTHKQNNTVRDAVSMTNAFARRQFTNEMRSIAHFYDDKVPRPWIDATQNVLDVIEEDGDPMIHVVRTDVVNHDRDRIFPSKRDRLALGFVKASSLIVVGLVVGLAISTVVM
ncbi:hypothetical protein [Corynebacterium cystitidis]|uniref:hypothetical protein n=1 Tax=Corynebacterium cystitidis TaxID=35757 RepID=UPI00211F33EE|nr:hypothetical protein [Corynebacterium cystitidis]